jgi:hypothetical protein
MMGAGMAVTPKKADVTPNCISRQERLTKHFASVFHIKRHLQLSGTA